MPFAARYFIAWSVWQRERGWWPSGPVNRVPGWGRKVTFRDGGAFAISIVVATALVMSLNALNWTAILPAVVTWIGLACSGIASVVYIFIRLHRDDLASAKLRQERLLERLVPWQEQSAPSASEER
jgi:hypothetical protein